MPVALQHAAPPASSLLHTAVLTGGHNANLCKHACRTIQDQDQRISLEVMQRHLPWMKEVDRRLKEKLSGTYTNHLKRDWCVCMLLVSCGAAWPWQAGNLSVLAS